MSIARFTRNSRFSGDRCRREICLFPRPYASFWWPWLEHTGRLGGLPNYTLCSCVDSGIAVPEGRVPCDVRFLRKGNRAVQKCKWFAA